MEVRLATDADVVSLATLRRAWTESAEDPDFERRFAQWWRREADRRISWLAALDGEPVGMLNMAVFERMPRPMKLVGIGPQPALSSPGKPVSRWGYIANVFVLAAHRNQGLGRLLLDAAIAHARSEGYARVVLSPTDRAIPFYRRAGFRSADELLVLPL